jgi:hypothetical protein
MIRSRLLIQNLGLKTLCLQPNFNTVRYVSVEATSFANKDKSNLKCVVFYEFSDFKSFKEISSSSSIKIRHIYT